MKIENDFEPVLVIGDVHHRVDEVEALIRRYRSRASKVVLLGDYFDAYGDTADQMRETCRWLVDSVADSGRIHLLGNHDIPYFLPGRPGDKEFGWGSNKQAVFDEECKSLSLDDFRLSINFGHWLLSHAGCLPVFGRGKSAIEIFMKSCFELQKERKGTRSPYLACGKLRAGPADHGGLTWADWTWEFEPIADMHQVVGHTYRPTVRGCHLKEDGKLGEVVRMTYDPDNPGKRISPGDEWLSVNWCIDTGLRYAALLSPDGCEFLPAENIEDMEW